jgi:adenylyl-sulfate kinase
MISSMPDYLSAQNSPRIAPGFVLWFTGLSGAGKSTLSLAIAPVLRSMHAKVEVLDGDEVRTHLSAGLTFSKADRDINVRRIGYVARLLSRNGVIAITAAISPYKEIRDVVRTEVAQDGIRFVEVYVHCEIEKLSERDVKGLYKKALAGQIPHFTGVSDPYERPDNPEVIVNSGTQSVDESMNAIMSYLKSEHLLP